MVGWLPQGGGYVEHSCPPLHSQEAETQMGQCTLQGHSLGDLSLPARPYLSLDVPTTSQNTASTWEL